MKTSQSFLKLFNGVLLVSSLLTLSAQAAERIQAKAVRVNNEWVAEFDLPEVEVSASRLSQGTGRVCRVTEIGGELVPTVYMNDVMINASGNYENNKLADLKVEPMVNTAILLPVENVNGELIPSVQGPEVMISASPLNDDSQAVSANELSKVQVAQTGFRKTFDRVLLFFIREGKAVLESLASSWMNK